MLPDFENMAQVRLTAVEDPAVRAGVAFHHRVDAAFHAAPVFVAMMGDALEQLESAGFARGPARAAAHVGIELLLDGELAERPEAVAAYRSALRHDGVGSLYALDDGAKLGGLRDRLLAAPLPQAYAATDFVADRLIAMLWSRPRLHITAEQRTPLERCLQDIQVAVKGHKQTLLDYTAYRSSEGS